MPELPEVETVRKSLEATIVGRTVTAVDVHWGGIVKDPLDVEEFQKRLVGQTIQRLGRRGKFLLFYMDTDVLISHLRMEGKYGVFANSEPLNKHDHVIFHFADGDELRYKDVRKFGTMHLRTIGTEEQQPPLLKMGPEPFSEAYTAHYLKARLQKTNRLIKPAMLDQTIVVGLGNIYIDESLFRAKIHPERLASSLTTTEVERLHRETKATLEEAVEQGGTTIRSYVNALGQIGLFQHELLVYGRAGAPCKRCETILQKTKVGGRGTVTCPKCQKLD